MTTQIKDATGATVTRMTFDDIVGTAGTANANVTTVQGIAGGTGLPVSGTVTANLGATDSTNLATVATQQTSATSGIGAPADATWSGTGSGSLVAISKYIALSQTPTYLTTSTGTALTTFASGSDASTNTVTGVGVYARPYVYNGSTWDRQRKTNIYKRVVSSAASGNPDFLKAAAGDLMQFWGVCGITAAFLQVYNKASAPTIGTDTPILTYPIPANGIFTQTLPGGSYFNTGIAYAFTTDAAGTTGSAAAAVTSFAIMGA